MNIGKHQPKACQPWQSADSLAKAQPGLEAAGIQVFLSPGVRCAILTLRAWTLREGLDHEEFKLLQVRSFRSKSRIVGEQCSDCLVPTQY